MTVYNDLAVVILAAGKGTRMKSELAKVLHKVSGKCMVNHVISAASSISPDHIHIVIGHQAELVQKEVLVYHDVHFALQSQLLGTGDAVKAALPGIGKNVNHVLVLCGDVPLIQPLTLTQLVNGHLSEDAKITVLSTIVDNPTGYGRIITDNNGDLVCIREEADASVSEKKVKMVNTGIYCFEKSFLAEAIEQIVPENNQAEYYLTDLVEIAKNKGEKITSITMDDPRQVMGVNTLQELDTANRLIDKVIK